MRKLGYSEELKRIVLERVGQGESIARLSKLFGMSDATIHNWRNIERANKDREVTEEKQSIVSLATLTERVEQKNGAIPEEIKKQSDYTYVYITQLERIACALERLADVWEGKS